uniref:Putative transposase n=1 Tax=Moniliophthora roreri TaxID=221103 RepID=A0A0W0GEZ6_MONRR
MGRKGTSSVNAKKKAKPSATNEKKPHAVWSEANEENLLEGLVAETLNPPASGGDKVGKGCKDKYGTIKHNWEEVIKINHKSGWPPWDRQLGANITPEHENNWNEYVKANPKAASFQNKGYKYQKYFDVLMPLDTALPKQLNVCRIGRKKAEAQDSDEEDNEGKSMSDGAEESVGNAGEVEERVSAEWDFTLMSQQLGAADGDRSDPAVAMQLLAYRPIQLSREPSNMSISTTTSDPASTGQKRGASETPLPKEKTLEKCIKSQAPVTPVPCHERPSASSDHRAKAATALEQIGSGVTEFNQHAFALFGSAGREQNNTPGRLAGAIKAMDNEKVWLPLDLRLQLQDLLEKDKAAVVTYCNMDPNDKLLRRRWILRKLNVSVPNGHDLLSDTLLPITPLDYYLPSFN